MRVKRTNAFAVVGPLPHVIVYVAVPLLVSRDGRHHGWTDGPSAVNHLGLLPVSAGATLIGWALASHDGAAPEEVRISVAPEYLVGEGAYAVTRNPMYLGGAAMVLGLAVFFGSLPIALVGGAYVVGMDRLAIPFEQRMLHDTFGDSYDQYRGRVPRWVKLRRPRRRC